MNVVDVRNVQRSFGGLLALELERFTVAEGQRRAVLGPNGAGKTTLFNIITGAIAPTRGRVHLFGSDVTRLSVHRRSNMGLARTFQITNLFSGLTVEENVLVALMAADGLRLTPYRAVHAYPHLMTAREALLRRWGLWEVRHQVAHDLSYGYQRKIELVLALTRSPRLLLLDEPTAGLSLDEIPLVTSMIEELERDMTILLIEHDMDVAFALADSVTVLFQGSVVLEGSPEQVRTDPQVAELYFGREED